MKIGWDGDYTSQEDLAEKMTVELGSNVST